MEAMSDSDFVWTLLPDHILEIVHSLQNSLYM